MNLKNIINLSAVFSIYVINKLKDGLGGWEIVSVSVNNHADHLKKIDTSFHQPASSKYGSTFI
jgi:hypothetical protein